jgi:hypothetical protein
MKLRAFSSQVVFDKNFSKNFWDFQKWTKINVQNRKPKHFYKTKVVTEKMPSKISQYFVSIYGNITKKIQDTTFLGIKQTQFSKLV